ncbi:Peroxiredoxin [Flavobacteriaceae bacterium MAR_2010_188]|nr:Peroxiredoxin [Flavobacteriaceae bacterium MAR_2010_188]
MIKPREKAPNLEVELVNHTRWILDEQDPENFTMIIFYRGKHCPVCKTYLNELQTKISQFIERGVNIIALSSDTEEVAKKTYEEWDIDDIPVGYGFPIETARKWGLFISNGIKDEPKQFIEPGVFLIRPARTIYAEYIQSIPFARPHFDDLLKGIDFILKKDYPARGEA